MPKLSEAYVLGLLADLEEEVPQKDLELTQARARAQTVDGELSNLVRRLDDSNVKREEAESTAASSATEINEKNLRISSLHQEIAGLKRRSDDLKTEMDRVGPGAIHRKLRRDRAKISVQIDDRETEVIAVRARADALRETLHAAEAAMDSERDRSRGIVKELDKLQSQLPSPYLYSGLFDRRAARAHCRLYLDRDIPAWQEELRTAIDLMTELHEALRAGKYRLDKNSDIVGGRSMATAEAIYGALVLGDSNVATDLFELATAPSLFFHQIFNVFRCWCLGLYLTGERRQLRELLRIHQFATGLRGGYVETFYGLLGKEKSRVARGLRAIAKHEWEVWQDPKLVRGAGVVNLGCVALTRLALDRGLAVRLPGPTVPDILIAGPSSRRAR